MKRNVMGVHLLLEIGLRAKPRFYPQLVCKSYVLYVLIIFTPMVKDIVLNVLTNSL